MPFRLLLRCLWPLAASLLISASLLHAHPLPNWAIAAAVFAAGGIGAWCAARVLFGESEARLRQTEARLGNAQRIAAMGSWELDLASGELSWSKEMYRIWHPLPADYSPMRDGVLRHICEADRHAVAEWLAQLKTGGAPPAMEFRVPAGEGATKILRAEGSAVRDSAGEVIQVAGTLRDVTENRRLERERDELHVQLLHAHKLEALGTLAGGVAHELNNALVPVVSLAKIVMAKLAPGSREHASVELMLEAGQRASNLVRQVLIFARKSEAERKPLALDGMVADVLRAIRPSLPVGVTIEQHLWPVPLVAADAAELEQVIMALLTNATQAIGENGGAVIVEVASDRGRLAAMRASTGPMPGVRISISDTGCGMDTATKRRVFEPFFTTKDVGRGMGLGLAVVHGIVAAHGGRIAVESEPGVGTRFDIYLPCIGEAAAAA